MRALRASCFVATLAVQGCSLVAVRPPPASPPPAGAPVECTKSRLAPGLDTAGAVVAPLMGLGLWGLCAFVQTQQSWSSSPQDMKCGTIALAALGATGLYAGSAVYGFQATGACRELVGSPIRPGTGGALAKPPESLANAPWGPYFGM